MAIELMAEWQGVLLGFLSSRARKPIIVDKITPYLGTAAAVMQGLQQDFPDARIIQLVRDGRDVVTSGVYDWIGREPPPIADDPQTVRRAEYFTGAGDNRKQPMPPLDRFLDDGSIRTWAQYWTQPHQALVQSPIPAERIITIRYEQMLDDYPAVLARLFRFLGVAADDSRIADCIQATTFEKSTGRNAGTHQPLAKARKGIAGDWKDHFTRHDARLFHRQAGATMKALGYEPDDCWVSACPPSLRSR